MDNPEGTVQFVVEQAPNSAAARQLGRANTKTLFDTYSRWIDGADKGVERRALEAAMGGSQACVSQKEKS